MPNLGPEDYQGKGNPTPDSDNDGAHTNATIVQDSGNVDQRNNNDTRVAGEVPNPGPGPPEEIRFNKENWFGIRPYKDYIILFFIVFGFFLSSLTQFLLL